MRRIKEHNIIFGSRVTPLPTRLIHFNLQTSLKERFLSQGISALRFLGRKVELLCSHLCSAICVLILLTSIFLIGVIPPLLMMFLPAILE